MGLDMYLSLKKVNYTSSNRTTKNLYPKELHDFEEEIRERNFAGRSIETFYQVGYWRKANAIHNWFVENCGDGEDLCQEIVVDTDKLEQLKRLCEKVLETPDLASELLPTTEGFFFGSTEYDDWYFDDIKYTIHILTKVIEFMKKEQLKHDYDNYYEVIYQASW